MAPMEQSAFLERSGMTSLQLHLWRLAFVAIALTSCGLPAAAARAQPVDVKDAWVRAPAPGQNIAAAYMELKSKTTMVLVAVSSTAAGAAELHITTMEAGVMKMRPVAKVELPGSKTVKLAPGGVHLMLIDLKKPLKPGDKVPLTLTVQRPDAASRSVFTVLAEVRAAAAEPTPSHHHH
jgi:periplasmic copper chaperone A